MMVSLIKGKVALITGGATGLGKAIAEAMLDRGAKVCVADINSVAGAQTEIELRGRYNNESVHFRKCDITSERDFQDTLENTIKRYGKLDILCNNAAITDEKNWQIMVETNLTALIRDTFLAVRYMGTASGQQDGLIINIASVAGVMAAPHEPIYTACKHGVVGFTRSIGVVSPKLYGVRVNCLCPGAINTTLLDSDNAFFEISPNDKAGKSKVIRRIVSAVGSMEPREVAESVIRLAETKDASGATMLVVQAGQDFIHLPVTIPEMFAKYSKI